MEHKVSTAATRHEPGLGIRPGQRNRWKSSNSWLRNDIGVIPGVPAQAQAASLKALVTSVLMTWVSSLPPAPQLLRAACLRAVQAHVLCYLLELP